MSCHFRQVAGEFSLRANVERMERKGGSSEERGGKGTWVQGQSNAHARPRGGGACLACMCVGGNGNASALTVIEVAAMVVGY